MLYWIIIFVFFCFWGCQDFVKSRLCEMKSLLWGYRATWKEKIFMLVFSPQSWKSPCGFSGCKALKNGIFRPKTNLKDNNSESCWPVHELVTPRRTFPQQSSQFSPCGVPGDSLSWVVLLCAFSRTSTREALLCQDSTSTSIYDLSQSFWRGKYFFYVWMDKSFSSFLKTWKLTHSAKCISYTYSQFISK